MLSPHIFSHFYTATSVQKVRDVIEWSRKLGSNPIFVMSSSNKTPIGYVFPQTIAKSSQETPLVDIIRTCPILHAQSIHTAARSHDKPAVFLVRDDNGICGWCDSSSLVRVRYSQDCPTISGISSVDPRALLP